MHYLFLWYALISQLFYLEQSLLLAVLLAPNRQKSQDNINSVRIKNNTWQILFSFFNKTA